MKAIKLQNKVMEASADGLLQENNLDYIENICLKIDINNIDIKIPSYYFDLWGEKLFLDKSKYYLLLLANPEYDDMFDLLDKDNSGSKKIRYITSGSLKNETLEETINSDNISTPNLINKNI